MSRARLRVSILLALSGTLVACAAAPTPKPSPAQPDAPQRLRVVSWNVGLGIFIKASAGRSSRGKRLSRLSRGGYSVRGALSHNAALREFDILGLQELCGHNNAAHMRHLDAIFPEHHRFFGQTHPARFGECKKGQAIYSRAPIVGRGVLLLPRVGGRSLRSAIFVDIVLPPTQKRRLIRVYNVHLENRSHTGSAQDARLVQVEALLEHARDWRARHPEAAIIILGDLNTTGALLAPWTIEPAVEALRSEFSSALTGFEPTYVLPYQLDGIYYHNLSLTASQVERILLSDHYPLTADFLLLE